MAEHNFEKENQVFKDQIQKWLTKKKAGKFVVINGSEVLGFYDDSSSAFTEGAKKFGLGQFFMSCVLPTDSTNITFLGVAI